MTFDTHLNWMPSVLADLTPALGKLTIRKMRDRAMADFELGALSPQSGA